MEQLNVCPICRRYPAYNFIYKMKTNQVYSNIRCNNCGIEVYGENDYAIRIWNHLKYIDYDSDYIDEFSCFD